MRSKVLSLLLLVVLLVTGACGPQATDAPVPTDAPASGTVTVFAAASLTEAFTELGTLFEADHPGVKVVFNFAGSQALSGQLREGAPADVFASANTKEMDNAIAAGRVADGSQKTFAQNKLVVIYPTDNPAGLATLQDLAKPGLKLVLAAVEVPVGKYSVEFLDKATQDAAFGATFKDDVLKNVASYEDNVKSVLTKVVLGEADAGIVYLTDISQDSASKVGRLDIPDALNAVGTYPIAVVSDAAQPDLAQAFVDLVLAPDGQAVLAKYGFIQAAPASSSGGSFTVTDALGRQVSFNAVPQRIVLAGKALFMVADAIYTFPEAGKNIVALGSTAQGGSNFIPMIDPTFEAKVSLDSSAGAEQIAAAQPDCVIMKSTNAETLGKSLEAINIPVVYLDFETPDQYERDLDTLGQLFQNPDRAKQVAAFYQDGVKAITDQVSGLSDDQKPRTLIVYYSDKDNTVAFNVPPMSWMQTLLVTTAGGLPVWEDANPGGGWTKVSLEQVAAWNPDVILVIAYFNPVDEVVAMLKADPQWQALDAVKEGKIYGFATDVYSWDQPDPRWILGLKWVASKLHPDLFPSLDIQQEAQTFYSELYGMSEASYKSNIQPILAGDID